MIKKITIIAMIVILLLSGISVIGIGNENKEKISKINESINLSDLSVKEIDDKVKLDFDQSTSFTTETDKPMIPVLTKVYNLPFGSTIKNVDVSFSDSEQIILTKTIKKAPEPKSLINLETKNKEKIMPEKTEVVTNADVYPTKSFEYTTGTGLYNGKHSMFLVVHCYPVRFLAKENKVSHYKNVDISIEYQKPVCSTVFEDEYDMLIITPEVFSQSLGRLMDHKKSNNVETILKTTEEIYSSSKGRDKAEKIKYFIYDAIKDWGIDYVLIVGDMDYTPMRMTDINIYNSEGIPTDLYYADVFDSEGDFCCWDGNNNDVFGEYDRHQGDLDDLDLYADVYIGRIPCKNNRELNIVIDKIMTYETSTYGQNWFNNAVLMGGDTFPNHGPLEGEMVTDAISEELTDFNCIKLWTSMGNYNWLNINRKITDGAGFVSYSGHGYQFGFGTSAPNEEERIEYYTPYALGMRNKEKYPVIFFDACSTAELDYNFYGIKLPTFAWFLIKKPVGGAVATIGATRVAFTMVDNDGIHGGAGFLNLHFFKAYKPGISVSEMLVQSQNDYLNNAPWKDCVTLEEFNLLGDPSLKIGGYSS
jgi:hypothetical protein